MRDCFTISDTHFSHNNIIQYSNRPFANAKEMDEVLCERWIETVKVTDIVYHLGDVGLGVHGRYSVLKKLPGHKRLILGNHDPLAKNDGIWDVFEKVMLQRMFPELKVILTHVPIHPSGLGTPKITYNIHGHIHEKLIDDYRYINACVEHNDYRPVEINDLIAKHKIRFNIDDDGTTTYENPV